MRILMGGLVLAGGAVLVAAPLSTVASAGAASADSPQIAVACTHLKGTATYDTAKVTGCPTASTGGKGAITDFLPSGGDVTWANGSTTDYTATATNPATGCPAGSSLFKIVGSVTGGTNTSTPVGQAVKMKICLNQKTDALVNETGTTVKF